MVYLNNDVIRHIICFLDRSTLSSASLVCAEWRPLAQCLLFTDIKISPSPSRGTFENFLMDLTKSKNQQLRPAIQHLAMSIAPHDFYRRDEHNSVQFCIVALILFALPSLRTFELHHMLLKRCGTLCHKFRHYYLPIRDLPRLERLVVNGVIIQDWDADPFRILQRAHNISRCDVSRVNWLQTIFEPAVATFSERPSRDLTLTFLPSVQADTDIIFHIPPNPHLHTLKFFNVSAQSWYHLDTLLERGTSLSALTISLAPDEMGS